MNKKILRLALDAGVLNYVDLETPRRYFVSAHANEEDVEEFAKLIVRECIEISQVGSITETKLKQHFGIEE